MAVVTISRLYGTSGNQIGRRVAEILGYSYFDKKVMLEVATEMDVAVEDFVDFTEDTYQMRNFVKRLLGLGKERIKIARYEGVDEVPVEVKSLNREASISLVRKTLLTTYERGNVIIVGRGGQVVLRDKPGVLHVRIEAPLSMRVRELMEREGITAAEAENWIIERDRNAEAYLRAFYDINWSHLAHYHLVVNACKWEVEEAAQAIAAIVERGGF